MMRLVSLSMVLLSLRFFHQLSISVAILETEFWFVNSNETFVTILTHKNYRIAIFLPSMFQLNDFIYFFIIVFS